MNPFTAIANPFRPIENLLEDLLHLIHDETGLTWAWSIVALMAIVRLAIFPITAKGTRSMLAMQRLQPYMKQLQEKYKKDRQELNTRMLEFYRDNKVNPLASCFPLLLQLPIFLALFFVLKDFNYKGDDNLSFLFGFVSNITTEVKAAGFDGWVLLLFYVISQVFSSKVMMTSPDPRQRMMFMLLPVVIAPFLIGFPIGVLIYWITTNLWTLAQHVVIVKFTNTDREVIMPRDNKDRKKVIGPKDDKGKGADAGKTGDKDSTKKNGSGPQRPARKNKRRR